MLTNSGKKSKEGRGEAGGGLIPHRFATGGKSKLNKEVQEVGENLGVASDVLPKKKVSGG